MKLLVSKYKHTEKNTTETLRKRVYKHFKTVRLYIIVPCQHAKFQKNPESGFSDKDIFCPI